MNSYSIGLACGVGFLAYCLYLDHKRRHAPDYKEKVRARREQERQAEDQIDLPPAGDEAASQAFFVREIEVGEELIQAGEVDRALKHISYAIVLCPNPQQLLQYMQEVLPTSAYHNLVKRLPEAKKRVTETYCKTYKKSTDEDVE